METAEKGYGTLRGNRVHFLDNLRAFVIFLVILCHAGWVYESSGIGALFWIVDDPATNTTSGLVNVIVDIFMMPTLFLISGYLAPASLEHKSGWTFIKAKLRRLLLPWAVAMLTLIPLYKLIFLASRGLPQEEWTTYFHFSGGIFSQNWLWFLPVLFLFNLVYVLLAKTKIGIPNLSPRIAIASALVVGFAYSLSMDLLGLQGWTKTKVLDFQNERLLIYFLAFLVGTVCFRRRVFDAPPAPGRLYPVVSATAWVPVTAYSILLLYPFFKPGSFVVSEIAHKSTLWLTYQLSLLCLVYLAIETFRRYLNKPGKLRNELSANSYSVYIIHVIVMGSLALVLLDLAIPSLVKYLVLTVTTYVVSNVIASVWRRISALSPMKLRPSAILRGQESVSL